MCLRRPNSPRVCHALVSHGKAMAQLDTIQEWLTDLGITFTAGTILAFWRVTDILRVGWLALWARAEGVPHGVSYLGAPPTPIDLRSVCLKLFTMLFLFTVN